MATRRRSLPIVHKASYLARFLQFVEELAHGFGLTRQDQTAPDISQRSEDELSQVHSRMRQDERRCMSHLSAIIEKIEVENARGVAFTANTTKLRLCCLQSR